MTCIKPCKHTAFHSPNEQDNFGIRTYKWKKRASEQALSRRNAGRRRYVGWRRMWQKGIFAAENGSFTVEAALALPIWIAGLVALLFFLIAIRTQLKLQTALFEQVGKAAGYGYYLDQTDIPDQAENFLSAEYVKMAVINEVGQEYLDSSFICNGANGIALSLTTRQEEGTIDAALSYSMQPPFDLLGVGKLHLASRARCRIWNGAGTDTQSKEVTMVYVTAEGSVYHTDRDCTYIKVRYESCRMSEISAKRNEDGGKYYPCSYCCKKNTSDQVYYMKYGTRYHSSLQCPNFKRNVYTIDLETAKEKYRACSKCAK